ncbi:MAG: Fe-S-containing protein [Campylobacteraceae bacterium]
MSIYFYHVIQVFLGLVLWLSIYEKKLLFRDFVISSLVGILFAFAFFRVANDYLWIDNLKLFSDCLAIFLLVFGGIVYLFRFSSLKIVVTSLLVFSFGIYYRVYSHNFPLFSGELLDTQSIISFGFTLLGFALIVLTYLLLKYVFSFISKGVKLGFFVITTILLLTKLFGDVGLELMRNGVLEAEKLMLSVIAKLIFYGLYLPYVFTFLIIVLLIIYLLSAQKLPSKDGSDIVLYRKLKAKRDKIFSITKSTICVLLVANVLLLYYDLHASKPPTISTPTILEPVNGEFRIPIETLRDNDLHRFAYITDAGNKVRFFMLNRFPDRDSPTVVFDACMICGDMGYVKKGDELICIACNVRIFLPSVGKEGGCNPIPFPFEFDGKEIIVKLSDVEKGTGYFSEVVEKEVTDPVSKKKIINLKAPYNYFFGGKTYFFESQESYDAFRKEPEKYVEQVVQNHWRAQGFVALGEEEK